MISNIQLNKRCPQVARNLFHQEIYLKTLIMDMCIITLLNQWMIYMHVVVLQMRKTKLKVQP